ncbi:hypothetical protein NDU88_002561 [Pleurodeles waltl]|uniref:Uncharacterized protein n=1 Tax=Pleurodeles waltl TaxID=8319 RepID=A0AAV7T2L6_PLEWA|nr:hypothetical protein NDU88_002561 [Pleurodeles waltl]
MKPPPPLYPKVTTLLLRGGGGPCCGWAAVLQPRWLPCLAVPQNPLLNPKPSEVAAGRAGKGGSDSIRARPRTAGAVTVRRLRGQFPLRADCRRRGAWFPVSVTPGWNSYRTTCLLASVATLPEHERELSHTELLAAIHESRTALEHKIEAVYIDGNLLRADLRKVAEKMTHAEDNIETLQGKFLALM